MHLLQVLRLHQNRGSSSHRVEKHDHCDFDEALWIASQQSAERAEKALLSNSFATNFKKAAFGQQVPQRKDQQQRKKGEHEQTTPSERNDWNPGESQRG